MLSLQDISFQALQPVGSGLNPRIKNFLENRYPEKYKLVEQHDHQAYKIIDLYLFMTDKSLIEKFGMESLAKVKAIQYKEIFVIPPDITIAIYFANKVLQHLHIDEIKNYISFRNKLKSKGIRTIENLI